jgi:hypothetical protein
VAAAARESGEDVVIVCAGFKNAFALDDAYCAGRVVQLVGGERDDSSKAAELIARSFPNAYEGLTARTYGPPGLEEDISLLRARECARRRAAVLPQSRSCSRNHALRSSDPKKGPARREFL